MNKQLDKVETEYDEAVEELLKTVEHFTHYFDKPSQECEGTTLEKMEELDRRAIAVIAAAKQVRKKKPTNI